MTRRNAAIITERGTTELSMQEVAGRAEVSLRTVYRYFPSRQALLDGLTDLIDTRMADLRRDEEVGWEELAGKEPQDLLRVVPAVFERFDQLRPLSSAMVLLSAGGYRTAAGHDQRTEIYRGILAEHLADLDPAEAEQVFAVFRHLLSSSTWFALSEEFGLSGRAAGEVAARAAGALLSDG